MKQRIVGNLFAHEWWSVFYNPFHITRRKLFLSFQSHRAIVQGRVLDFGCGSKPYKSLFLCESYTGCDLAVSGHDQSESEQIELIYDGKTIPAADQSFDTIFSSEVLEHIFNPDQILGEWFRVLKSSGHVMLSCPFFWREHEMPYDYCRYTSAGLRDLLQRNGFVIEYQGKLGNRFSVFFQLLNIFTYDLFGFHRRAWWLGVPIYGIVNLAEAFLGAVRSEDGLYLSNFVILRKRA